MVDVFEEVDEQLRSQQYTTLLRKSWPFVAAAVGVVAIGGLGVWGWSQHESSEEAKASVTYQAAIDAAGQGDQATADRDFTSLAASAPPAYRALALMQEAQIRLDQKRPDDAVRLFDQAAKAAPDQIIRDGARLKAAWVLMDSHPLAEVESRLTPLTTAKAPFRPLALEALAMARLQAGKLDEAKGDFSVLPLMQDVSAGAQARAKGAAELIQSGSAAVLPAAVKSALTLPPMPTTLGAPRPPQAAPSAQAGAGQ